MPLRSAPTRPSPSNGTLAISLRGPQQRECVNSSTTTGPSSGARMARSSAVSARRGASGSAAAAASTCSRGPAQVPRRGVGAGGRVGRGQVEQTRQMRRRTGRRVVLVAGVVMRAGCPGWHGTSSNLPTPSSRGGPSKRCEAGLLDRLADRRVEQGCVARLQVSAELHPSARTSGAGSAGPGGCPGRRRRSRPSGDRWGRCGRRRPGERRRTPGGRRGPRPRRATGASTRPRSRSASVTSGADQLSVSAPTSAGRPCG